MNVQMTTSTKLKDIKRKWHLVDVQGKILGRVASSISQLLIGKSKPYFVSYLDCGDYVVVVNSSKVKVTGKKGEQKMYMRYSGFPGGLKAKSFDQVQKEDPIRIIVEAVSGMLPQNKLRASMLKRLFAFTDEEHPYKEKLNQSS
ncbi:50S ribosomal protein L13 [Candidatus Gottesmanbacteria bacterium]|nr:50S ribosomal protein L13 [Candidatus Gottesmanbacteria bacterium]